MKVLYYHQHFSTPAGAASNRSYAMAQHLIAQGHGVTVVCGSYAVGQSGLQGNFQKGKREGIVDGIHVIELELPYSNGDSFPRRTWIFIKFALQSTWIALQHDFDLVFATTTPLTAGIPGIFARWLRRKPFIFEVRDLWPELPKAMGVIRNPLLLGAMSVLEWTSYHTADLLIGLSPGIVEGIAKQGIDPQRIRMIPNGCDLDIFATSVAPWRPEGVSDSDLMAIFTGSHGIANGLDAILHAAIELKRRNCNHIKIVLIGDGKLKKQLIEFATSNHLDNVIFHAPVPKTRLAGLMAAADIGMQILANVPAFYYGTSPNKFFDYIAAGLPVLNNYPGWLADMITTHQCGYVVPPDDPVAFVDALMRAAAYPEERVAMGRNARQLANQDFARTKLAEQFVRWLESVQAPC